MKNELYQSCEQSDGVPEDVFWMSLVLPLRSRLHGLGEMMLLHKLHVSHLELVKLARKAQIHGELRAGKSQLLVAGAAQDDMHPVSSEMLTKRTYITDAIWKDTHEVCHCDVFPDLH